MENKQALMLDVWIPVSTFVRDAEFQIATFLCFDGICNNQTSIKISAM